MALSLCDLAADVLVVVDSEVVLAAVVLADLAAGAGVVADLLSTASAGAVNNDAASNAAEMFFNMVSSWFRDGWEMRFPFVLGAT
jgi:predicted RNA methylase